MLTSRWKGVPKFMAPMLVLSTSFPVPEECCGLGKQEGILVLLFLRDCVA